MPGNKGGFKPHVVTELIGITDQTLRYWRKNLDPQHYRTHFSGPSVLALRTIKVFVKHRGVSVEMLKNCEFNRVFELFEKISLSQLKEQMVILDERSGTTQLVPLTTGYDLNDFHLHGIGLRNVVQEHIESLCRFGSPQTCVVDFSLQKVGVTSN